VIRIEMEATRDSLAQKIGELESQVRDTVTEAGEAVSATKEGVMDVVSSVSDTVSSVKESIKETFDLRKQVEDHPWGAFGVAVAAGMAGAVFLGSRSANGSTAGFHRDSAPASFAPAAAATAATAAASSASGVVSSVFSKLQAMAVTSLVDVVQDMVQKSAPEPWRDGLKDIVRELGSKLAGDDKLAH